ncbi:energy transducer TonB [Porticoccus sp.]
MKFLLALSVSLALHVLFVQWRWAPVLEDSGSAGRAALAIQQMRFVELKKPSALEAKQVAVTEVVTAEPEKALQRNRSLLPEPALPASVEFSTTELVRADTGTRHEKWVTENRAREMSPPLAKEENREKEQDLPPAVASPETEETLLEKVDKEMLAEVVSTSEERAEHAGFDQVPTMDQPRYRRAFPPKYPRLAKRRGQQGTVMVKARVGIEGEVEVVELLESSGYEVLDNCALKTVRQWQFYPYQVNQKRTVAWVEVPVEFTLGP